MTTLRAALEDYLRIRRQLGFELKNDERELQGFVDFLDQAGVQHITTDLAVGWARLPRRRSPVHVASAAGEGARVRALSGDDRPADSEVPSQDLLPARQQRVAPYIYSEQEISG